MLVKRGINAASMLPPSCKKLGVVRRNRTVDIGEDSLRMASQRNFVKKNESMAKTSA